MSFVLNRLVCAVLPFGESEEILQGFSDTNSIIGFDQYQRLKSVLSDFRVELLDLSETYDASDVLLIMSTIWTVPLNIFQRFKRVGYFYDDIDPLKAQTDKYKECMKRVHFVLHPEPDVTEELQKSWKLPTFHVPWSSGSVSETQGRNDQLVRIFLDIDDREFAKKSVDYAIIFFDSIKNCGLQVFVPDSALKLLPAEIIEKVNHVPRMSHEKFLKFIGGIDWYASGISSSYEYIVMESALLGCGLISIFNAVRRFHRNRACVIDFKGEHTGIDEIYTITDYQRRDQIRLSAAKLYPFDAVKQIPELIERVF